MKWAAPLAAALALLLSYPAIQHLREQPPPDPRPVQLTLPAPPGTEMGALDEPLDAAISPNQREVVFVASDYRRESADQPEVGEPQLWRRRFDGSQAERIAGTGGASFPAWKPTGNVLSFFAAGRLKLLNLPSGTITDVAEASAPAGATWLPDGSLLFVPGPGPIRRMRDGRVSDATALDQDDTAHVFPASVWGTPEFTYVAVSSNGRRTIRVKSSGGQTNLSPADGHGVLFGGAPGWLLWVKDGTLLADRRDSEGQMERRERALALETGVTRNGRGLFAVSPDVLLHAPAAERPRRLVWMDMSGVVVEAITDVGDYWQVRLSPDDRTAAVTLRDPLLRSLDVHLMPVTGTAPAWRITTSLGADTDPVWSADSRQIAFRTMRRGKAEVFVAPAPSGSESVDAKNAPVPIKAPGEIPTDWRPGELLAQLREGRGFDVVHVDQESGRVTPVASSPFNETDGRWSPDGRWIAYVSDESGRPDIYVLRSESKGGTQETPQRVSTGGGTNPRWTADGGALLFLRGSTVMRVEAPVPGARLSPPRALFDVPGIRDFDTAHRGANIAALVPAAGEPANSIAVLLNWRSLLAEQVAQSNRSSRQR